MKVVCKKCFNGNEVEIPDFTTDQKQHLSEIAIRTPMHAIKFLADTFSVSLTDAKFILNHINHTYGHCKRCNYNTLTGEYINCPKCGTLNFNWKFNKENS